MKLKRLVTPTQTGCANTFCTAFVGKTERRGTEQLFGGYESARAEQTTACSSDVPALDTFERTERRSLASRAVHIGTYSSHSDYQICKEVVTSVF